MTRNARLACAAALCAVAMLLEGCGIVTPENVEGVRASATESVKALNDTSGKAKTDAVCAMSLGAYGRMEAGDKKEGACLICLPNDICPTSKGSTP